MATCGMRNKSGHTAMEDTIACTLVDLLAPEDELALAAALMSPEETARAASIVRLPQRRRYIIARSSLRLLLGEALGVEARAVPLGVDEHGKPILTGQARGRLGFNLCHSGDIAVIAIGSPLAIGVDIEPIALARPRVAENFFSAAEIAALSALSGAAQAAAFMRLWTRKEAVVKAVGLGLRLPLDTFDCPVEEAARTSLTGCRFDPSLVARLVLLDCPVREGWTACVAVIDGSPIPVLSLKNAPPAALE